ncbi:MAG: stage III sporulation protein AC [Clostridia bacterium]|nr:stage III sporulation protein AC [Clostridia bacterium]
MDISLILKIAGIGLLSAVACQILSKSGKDEQSTLLSIAGIIIVFIMIVDKAGTLITSLKGVFGL